jgi:hypothetical protein
MLSQANLSLQCTSGTPLAAPQKNYELNSAFEKADRLLEPRAKGSQWDKNAQLTLVSQHKLAFT